jgi:uncharacterized protein (DUF342 family)
MQFSKDADFIEVQVAVGLDDLTGQAIRDALQEAGYARCFILTEQINQLLADYLALQNDIKLNKLKEGVVVRRKIAERRNAVLAIQIAADSMSAVAEIVAAWGGAPVSANDLVKAAQEAGVSFGFQKDAIVQLVGTASRAEPGSKLQQIIAVGRVMQPGQNASFEALVEGLTVRPNRPLQVNESKVDLRDFGVIPSVRSGDPVIMRRPPTKGIDGVSVRGDITLASPGQQVEWKPGEGTEVSPTDPDMLIASRDGMPRVLDAGAAVDEVYAVKKVDLSTGHVQFKGAVIINGDVTENMKVIAGGNIFIKGMAEGSLIESGGDIHIGGAIIGHQFSAQDNSLENFSTVVRAAGSIQCTLAQYARIECQGDFQATKQINHCDVNARSVIAGTEDKLNGKIVGGRFYLDFGLKAGILGALSESALQINLNRRVDPVLEKQQALKQNIAMVKHEMEQIRQSLEQMKQQERSEAALEQMKYLVDDFEAQKAIALALIEDVKLLEVDRLSKMTEVLVLVKQQMFAGIEFKLGSEILPVKREYGPSKIQQIEARLSIEPWVS